LKVLSHPVLWSNLNLGMRIVVNDGALLNSPITACPEGSVRFELNR
jgi:hypothetical protein